MEQFVDDVHLFCETFLVQNDNKTKNSLLLEREFGQDGNRPRSRGPSFKSDDTKRIDVSTAGTDKKENVHLKSLAQKKNMAISKSYLTKHEESQYFIKACRWPTGHNSPLKISELQNDCRNGPYPLPDESRFISLKKTENSTSSRLRIIMMVLVVTMHLFLACMKFLEYLNENKMVGKYVLNWIGGDDTLELIQYFFRRIGLVVFIFTGPPIDDVNNGICLIANPVFKAQAVSDCELCKDIKTILTPKNKTDQQPINADILLTWRPLIFRQWGTCATLLNLQEQLELNKHILESFTSTFTSNVDYVKGIQNLTNSRIMNRLLEDTKAHLTWTTHRYMTSQILRKMFPRPKLFPKEANIEVPRKIFIDGSSSSSYKFVLVGMPFAYYAQGTGSRTVMLHFKGCPACPLLKATMQSKDILIFNRHFWSPYSHPYSNSTSLGILGSYHVTSHDRIEETAPEN